MFKRNTIYWIAATLPEYDIKDSYIYKNYYRNVIICRFEDRKLIKFMLDNEGILRGMRTAQLVIMIVNIIVCFIVSICLTISEVYNLCGKDVPCIPGEGVEEKLRI